MRLRIGRRKANDPMRYYSQSPVSRPICIECAPPLAHAPTLRESHAHVGPRPLATALLGPTSHVWEHSPALLAIASQAFCASAALVAPSPWVAMDDLLSIIALGEGGGGEGGDQQPARAKARANANARSAADIAPGGESESDSQPAPVAAEVPDDLQDVLAVVAQGGAKRKYEQQSWQLMEKARLAKAAKQAQRKAGQEAAKRRASGSMVRAVSTHFPGIARTLGLPPQRLVMGEERAELLMRFACMPTVKRDGALQKAQNRAAALVAQSVMVEQSRFWRHLHEAAVAPQLAEHGLDIQSQRIHILTWGWDETAQRVKGFAASLLPGERLGQAASSAQVMMQQGRMVVYDCLEQDVVCSEPWFARGLLLQAQSADFILEGMHRSLPFDFSDSSAFCKAAAACRWLVVPLCSDRASANYRVVYWLLTSWQLDEFPLNVLPHLEPCAAHAVALIKARPMGTKDCVVVESWPPYPIP